MVEAKRKKGETFEAFLRRFNKKLVESGKLFQARKVVNFQKPESKNKRREVAIRRAEIKEQREYLIKTGVLRENNYRR